MPTKRTRRGRHRLADVQPWEIQFLETGEAPGHEWAVLALTVNGGVGGRALWERAGAGILARWIARRPGSRPWGWWAYQAPRWPRPALPLGLRDLGDVLLRNLCEPRARVGGTGTEWYRAFGAIPYLPFGLPYSFVSAFEAAYHRGEARDIHGHPIGQEFKGSGFTGVAVDPADPPTYESEASYLRRHRLLTDDELEVLTADDYAATVTRGLLEAPA